MQIRRSKNYFASFRPWSSDMKLNRRICTQDRIIRHKEMMVGTRSFEL